MSATAAARPNQLNKLLLRNLDRERTDGCCFGHGGHNGAPRFALKSPVKRHPRQPRDPTPRRRNPALPARVNAAALHASRRHRSWRTSRRPRYRYRPMGGVEPTASALLRRTRRQSVSRAHDDRRYVLNGTTRAAEACGVAALQSTDRPVGVFRCRHCAVGARALIIAHGRAAIPPVVICQCAVARPVIPP
jgi:hypothetical protein